MARQESSGESFHDVVQSFAQGSERDDEFRRAW
jgi:hypothetical protein